MKQPKLNLVTVGRDSSFPYNADAAGKRSHDGQSRDDRRIKLDLANVGADGVSVAVRICD